jgi:hypothetical protein
MNVTNIIIILFLCFEIISCKPTSNLKGNYQTVSTDSLVYNFDMKNHKYQVKVNNKVKKKGKFKIVDLSSEKTLLICNEIIMKRTGGFIKELDKSGDSIVIGVYDGYKNLGPILFEITKDINQNLSFRKTYVNELEETELEGKLIPKK